MKIGWSALACILVAGCVSCHWEGEEPADEGALIRCNGRCEREMWPRIILGISGSTPEAELDVVVRAEGDGTGDTEARLHGCSSYLPARYLCSYSVFAGRSDSTMTLTLTLKGSGASEEVVVDLTEYNTCGRQITYFLVEHDGASFQVGEPSLISPCQSIPE